MAALVAVVAVLHRPAEREDPPGSRPAGRPRGRLHGADRRRQGAHRRADRPDDRHPRPARQRARRHRVGRSRSRAPTRSPSRCPASRTRSRRSTSSARRRSSSSTRTTRSRSPSAPWTARKQALKELRRQGVSKAEIDQLAAEGTTAEYALVQHRRTRTASSRSSGTSTARPPAMTGDAIDERPRGLRPGRQAQRLHRVHRRGQQAVPGDHARAVPHAACSRTSRRRSPSCSTTSWSRTR